MAEKIFDKQVNYGWGLTLNMTSKSPAISKRIFDTYDDAFMYANDSNDSAIPGLTISVINDPDEDKNGLYFIKTIKNAINEPDAILEKINSLLDKEIIIDCGEY